MKFTFQVTSIQDLCEYVRNVIGSDSKKSVKNLIEVDKIDGKEIFVFCDQLKIQQILVNLVGLWNYLYRLTTFKSVVLAPVIIFTNFEQRRGRIL